MQNHHSDAPPLITTLTSHYFILHLSSSFQLESRVEHHMIQPNQPLTPHPLNNEKKEWKLERMEKHLPRRNSIFQLYFKEYYDSLYRGCFPLSFMCYACCCCGEVRMLCWIYWWSDYSVLPLDGDVNGCALDWMSEKGDAMRWRNKRDLQLLSLICSFQERVACFVKLDLLYCLCYYDSHGIRGDWLRVFCRRFFITVRDSCPWAVDTAYRLAYYAHCCRFIQLSWVHALFVLLHPCDMPCVMRVCHAVHSGMPE